MKKITALIITMLLTLSAVGCNQLDETGDKKDLLKGYPAQQVSSEPFSLGEANTDCITDFALNLFRESLDAEDNTLISPISVIYALAMTANGAKGETLAQIENTFGTDIDSLNAYLKAYKEALPEGDKYKLSIANSIWFTDDERFTVVPDFLQKNADYYGSDIYQLTLNVAACKQINEWVEDNTDGMIKEIVKEIPPEAVMYLVNAVAFDAEWSKMYTKEQIQEGVFTTESGDKQSVQMMSSKENRYLENGNATGFIKYYNDRKYAFATLLPNEGTSIEDYVAALTGEDITAMLTNAEETTVYVTMPKFETEYDVEMSSILTAMGMKDAFDSTAADFSGLGTSTGGNIFINRVIHKTYIAVADRGTKAVASTAIVLKDECAIPEPAEKVILDRPFVYMIIDCEENLPLFIGTLMDVEQKS